MTGIVNDLLGALPPLLVYAVVAILVAAEAAFVTGLVLPAATALVVLGLLANAQVVPIGPALAVAVAAAVVGGSLGFHFGRRRGPQAPSTRSGARAWARAGRLFARSGGRAVFLGQWVVGARTLVPRLAGMNGLAYRRFAAWHVPAAALWAGWLVGASYLAGASYDLLAARAGRAGGALAVLAALLVLLISIGRWLGRHPDPVRGSAALMRRLPAVRALTDRPRQATRPAAGVATGLAVLAALAALLLVAVPAAVRLSGLAEADTAIAEWAASQWTSDGYAFAVRAVTTVDPAALMLLAALVCLIRWWWLRLRGGGGALLAALGPVLPLALLTWCAAPLTYWQAPEQVTYPTPAEYDGYLPLDAATAMAGVSAGHTAQVTAAVGLLLWLLARRLPWAVRVAVWTGAASIVVLSAGSWIYLGWSRASETVAALLVGLAWIALNAAIWSTQAAEPAGAPRPAQPTRPTVGAAA